MDLSENRRRRQIAIHHRLRHGKTLGLPLIRRFLDPDSIGSAAIHRGCASARLSVAVCLADSRANRPRSAPRFRSRPLHLRWDSSSGRAARSPELPSRCRAEAVTGMPSAGRAGHLRVRDGYDEDRSPLYYLVAAAPLLVHPSHCRPTRRSVKSGTLRHTCFSASCWEARSGTSHAVSMEMPAVTSRSCSIVFHPP